MSRAYSLDLRERVVAAVERGGLSARQAAAQFGVGVSTAIRWLQRVHKTGSVRPSKIGGYKPRAIAGEHRSWLLARVKEKDFTLRGLVAELAGPGLKVDYRSVWELRARREAELQKKAWWLANAIALTWRAGGRNGSSIGTASILPAWCSSTRPGPRPTWRRCAAGHRVAAA